MNIKSITFLLTCLVTASVSIQLQAQQPVRHELIRGDMPPGVAAQFYQLSNPALRGQMQPVQLVAPAETTIEVGDAASSFGQPQASQMTVNMGIGYVYRFKLSNLPQPDAAGKTLYPSIEVIGKLNPPPGLEKDFPVQVVVTEGDIDLALTGRMVTRVIYLEDSRDPQLPHLHTVTDQPSVDVRRGQDPLRAAEQMGRPMAILRMGSRVPMENEVAEWFTFGVAAPMVMPNPRAVNRLGLSERELRIIQEMRMIEAEAKAAAASKSESTNQISQADFQPSDTGASELTIGTIAQTSDQLANQIRPTVATTPVVSEVPKAKETKWVKVKANATPKAEPTQSIIGSMIPIRAKAAEDKPNALPPAPSMAELEFEPVDTGGLKEPPRAYPIIRRPNEL